MSIHLVQYHPEIPHNTINMMRTCMGTGMTLHLIKPLGFSLNREHIKKAGVDFIDEVDYTLYENWEDFAQKNEGGIFCFCTQHGKQHHTDIDFSQLDQEYFIILGAESTGFPEEMLQPYLEHCFRVPMLPQVESLNVSSVGALVAYEALRQQNFWQL